MGKSTDGEYFIRGVDLALTVTGSPLFDSAYFSQTTVSDANGEYDILSVSAPSTRKSWQHVFRTAFLFFNLSYQASLFRISYLIILPISLVVHLQRGLP